MDIIFNPPVNPANKYIAIMADPLVDSGYRVHPLYGFFSSLRHFRSIKLVHLNWFENLDDSSYAKMMTSFFRKSLVLSVIRMSNKKLVWTMHNRVSHEKNSGRLSQILTDKLVKHADAIIIHCEQSRDLLLAKYPSIGSKIHYLTHPDFIGSYGPIQEEKEPKAQLRLLFLGAIKPYKNIELLINVAGQFGSKLELTIAGNPNSTEYRKRLSNLAGKYPNIILRLEFIPDSEIPKLIGDCDLLVLPYDLNSSLNSGTVILAFSYQKSVICPEIGTLMDMHEMKENFLSYTYQSDEDHVSKLKKMIETAYQKKRADPEVFQKMGGKMYMHIKQNYAKNMVADKLKQVYQSVLKS